jgi:hypothetical protein
MHRKRLAFCAVIYFVVSAASFASAADETTPGQTPEGAQAMLTLLAGQGTVKIDVDTGRGFNVTPATSISEVWDTAEAYDFWKGLTYQRYSKQKRSQTTYELPSRKLLSATADSTCKTKLEFSDDESKRLSSVRDHDYTSAGGGTYVGEIGLTIYPQGFTVADLDWAKIAKVEAIGSAVVMSPLSPRIRLQLPSPGLAARVAFAMEFLRMHCDPLGKTGF